MNSKLIWLSIVAVIISFFGGFYLANSLNGKELAKLQTENEQLKKNPNGAAPANSQNDSDPELSDDEIKQKIVEADKNPSNFQFQRNLGLALYRYGTMKNNANLITESGRLLQRAYDNDPKDYDATVALGNVYFDLGFLKKDAQSLEKGREFYRKAIEQKPLDSDVQADLGISFYVADPPELDKAAAQLQKTLEINPKHERALLFLTQTLIKQNKTAEAEKYLAKLKEINPKTPTLAELNTQMSQDGTIQKQ